jgi:multicomponent Na+:H+ antiporter subunit A
VLLALLAHFVAAVLAPSVVRILGARAFWLIAMVPAGVTAWVLVAAGGPRTEVISWIPAYQLVLAVRMDALALLMVVVVAGVGALVLIYCASYLPAGDSRLPGFAGIFVAFAGAMLGLVLADDLILLYVFWELTTVFSYLLIGYNSHERHSRRAAMTAIMVTASGGLAMLAGLIMIGTAAGTFRISEILARPPSGGTVTAALALVLVGALAKSALVPFHFWLPGAMAAPTPVSAYLHAAAMVKAGVYLIARLSPAFADVPLWRTVTVVFGLLTMVLGGWRALRQYDLKLLLAFGTVSQLGLLVVLVGAGTRDAALAGMYLLLVHAAFKAALFMVVGIVDHETGTRDLRKLSGLRTSTPVTCACAVIAAASMAGLPPLGGFVGKEAAFAAFTGDPLVLAVLAGGSVLTVAYSIRFVWGAFSVKPGLEPTPVDGPGAAFAAPVMVLAVLNVPLGLAAPLVGQRLAGPGAAERLALWHGFTLPLWLSALVLVAGAAMFLAGGIVARIQVILHPPVDAERTYRLIMRGVDRAADQATRLTQRGSLPVYMRFILIVLLIMPGSALLAKVSWDGGIRLWDMPVELLVAVPICLAALVTVNRPWRLAAVMCAGVTGVGTATMFALHGAPDLALTQFLTETVTLVAFVLVLRRLPPRFVERPVPGIRAYNAVLAAATGLLVAGMAYVAVNARTAQPVSDAYPAAAGQAGGTNIVNVGLVDLRAWDTMGETSVLLIAAAGVTGLIFLRRTPSLPRTGESTGEVWAGPDSATFEEPEAVRPAGTWLRGSETLSPERRSIIFEVIARAVFHPMLVLSVYLLFSGHGTPGGGFAAGLVAGLALAMRYLAGGRYELAEALPLGPGRCQGVGLTLMVVDGLVGLLLTGHVLRQAVLHLHVPVLGEVHFATSTIFDAGVYLVVVGVVLDILRAMGGELDRQVEEEGEEVVTA